MALNWKPALVLIAGVAAIGACNMTDAAEFTFDTDAKGSGGEGWASSWSGEPFDRITLAGPDSLTFVTDGKHAVSATGDADALEQLQYKVRDGELRIRRKSSRWSLGDNGEALIAVNGPALRALSIAGSGSAKVDRMESDKVTLSIAGSGDADVGKVITKSLEGSIAGSGSLKLAGNAESSEISIAGSGDVTMASDGSVDASLMGSGDVTIKGKAKCSSTAMGSGKINCG